MHVNWPTNVEIGFRMVRLESFMDSTAYHNKNRMGVVGDKGY